ncbi:MAG: carboxypeptidase-like regulatory domain-containing protein, partial [Bryobacteraceae bacterium]
MGLKSAGILYLLLALGFALSAQTPDSATIEGSVVDATGAAVGGVSLTATNTRTGLRRLSQTDARGRFSLRGLPVSGVYTVIAAK